MSSVGRVGRGVLREPVHGPRPRGVPSGASPLSGHSVASYFEAFSPAPGWDELLNWPPDIFALANLLLDHTEIYRYVVAPPAGRRWPPISGWNEHVASTAQLWRSSASDNADPPEAVRAYWDVVSQHRNTSLSAVRQGEPWELCQALLSLHAIADEACTGLASMKEPTPEDSFETKAWSLLADNHSLSRLSPARVRITPKSQVTGSGITIRSLSRHLALCYESVDVEWTRIEPAPRSNGVRSRRRNYNIVLVPWPFTFEADSFRPVASPLGNMDPDAFGFFEYAPRSRLDLTLVESILRDAYRRVRRVDVVILPEGALDASEVGALERVLARFEIPGLVSGVREKTTTDAFGHNYVHVGAHTSDGWVRNRQDKHHRWRVDGNQIRQYHLTKVLDPRRVWWEAIDLPRRTLQVIDLGGGLTTAALVCEDLARLDEVADLVRRIGPNIVIAVLLDGPQLATRWPSRYASVLADEPGSSVLTVTSLGMATRSRPRGSRSSRAVALWKDSAGGLREIFLKPGARAILLRASVGTKTAWTADGRRHEDLSDVALSGVDQLHATVGEPVRISPEGGDRS